MLLLIDSREQLPLQFKPDGVLTGVKRVTLPVGDYAAEFNDGSRPPIMFERKGLNDLFGTMGKGYPRFKKEIQRAKNAGLHLILIIEGTLGDVYAGVPHSSMEGASVVQKIFTLWMRYDLQPVFCASRKQMSAYIRETFYAVGRHYYQSSKAPTAYQRHRKANSG